MKREGEVAVFWPILTMALGALIFCGGAAWYFWPLDLHQETNKDGGRCRFNNFGPSSVVNLTAKLVLHFHVVVEQENGTR